MFFRDAVNENMTFICLVWHLKDFCFKIANFIENPFTFGSRISKKYQYKIFQRETKYKNLKAYVKEPSELDCIRMWKESISYHKLSSSKLRQG